jgi:(S)-mandelate dehydrogenase
MSGNAGLSDAVAQKVRSGTGTQGLSEQELRFPTVEYLRRRARQRIPKFAYDFVAGGCGENLTVARNRAAFDAIEILPRYGFGAVAVKTQVELFGRSYAAPIGISPMGLGSLVWPKMEEYLARAAQAANVPYVLATPAGAAIERIASLAPDVFWFQSYAAPNEDFRITFDMLRRAERAGAKALVVTIDTPVRAKRPEDMRNRLSVPFRPNLRTILDVARRPAWLAEVVKHGAPRAENFLAYMPPGATGADVAKFAQKEMRGGYSWNTVHRVRDAWSGPLIVKGILHPGDAETALRIGADGLLVSNHGGRTFDAAPPAINLLPVVKAAAGDATILLDSGVRSGIDVVRALALGARAVLTGRPFLFGVGAIGPAGGTHVLDLLMEETRQAMGQIGAPDLAAVGQAAVRYPDVSGFVIRPS